MCFSPEASFTAGAVLTVVGVETIRKVSKPSHLAFASVTAFFAFQQFLEGVLWVVIPGGAHPGLQKAAAYFFLIMAEVIWPVLIPFSVLYMERSPARKKLLWALSAVGAAIGLYYLRHILNYDLHAEISGRHIIYVSARPHAYAVAATLVYALATLTPFFVSSLKRAYIMGLIMTLSFVVSAVFYRTYLTSVWCFFAAMMSFVVYYIIRDDRPQAVK